MKDDHEITNTGTEESGSEQSEHRRQPITFVIVLTIESSETDPKWLWRVQAVETGEKKHFDKLTEFIAYVTERSISSQSP